MPGGLFRWENTIEGEATVCGGRDHGYAHRRTWALADVRGRQERSSTASLAAGPRPLRRNHLVPDRPALAGPPAPCLDFEFQARRILLHIHKGRQEIRAAGNTAQHVIFAAVVQTLPVRRCALHCPQFGQRRIDEDLPPLGLVFHLQPVECEIPQRLERRVQFADPEASRAADGGPVRAPLATLNSAPARHIVPPPATVLALVHSGRRPLLRILNDRLLFELDLTPDQDLVLPAKRTRHPELTLIAFIVGVRNLRLASDGR